MSRIESTIRCPDCGTVIEEHDYVVTSWRHLDPRPMCERCQRKLGVDARGSKPSGGIYELSKTAE